jgi:BNR repeat-containing family member
LTCLAGGALGAAPAASPVWQLEPGLTARGQKPESWELDLRGQSPEQARAAAAKLSSRLYGTANASLHQPLVVRTDFATPRVFGIGLHQVSSGGSDLVVKTNGVLAGRQVWPRAGATHQINRVFYVPLAPGSNVVSLEVAQPSGVVVISRYLIAESVAQLPQEPPPLLFGSVAAAGATGAPARVAEVPMTGGKLQPDDGYRGIWYYNQPTKDEYKFKYSGGFATYPYQHNPISVYCKEVDKTFFVYGGTTARGAKDPQELLHMVSYYDHKTGQVPRPRILLNKHTSDAHDNPTLQVDDGGYLWIFSSSHGTGRPSYIHRSTKPWSIDEFERILVTNFSYTQPWYVPGQGFLFLHTRYGGGKSRGIDAARCLFWMTSPDGVKWGEPQMLAGIEAGDYQVSWRAGQRVATAFDFHPTPGGLNHRANVYYLETADLGRTWRNARGETVKLPLTTTNNAALVYDSRADGRLAYLKDVNFDRNGHPVILFLTSKGFEPGPENGPRQWQTLRWTGKDWVRRPFTTSDNNYDHGSLYIEPDGTWRVIAPTELGAQPYNPGGDMVLWTSSDEGQTWKKVKQLTHDTQRNHTFARRPLNAHPEFYAFWADGNGREPSESCLYFTNQRGDHVWRLPAKMEGEFASPVIVGE